MSISASKTAQYIFKENYHARQARIALALFRLSARQHFHLATVFDADRGWWEQGGFPVNLARNGLVRRELHESSLCEACGTPPELEQRKLLPALDPDNFTDTSREGRRLGRRCQTRDLPCSTATTMRHRRHGLAWQKRLQPGITIKG